MSTKAIAILVAVAALSIALVVSATDFRAKTVILRSAPFSLEAEQTALLQFRHVLFCEGSPPVSVALSFSGSPYRRVRSMGCGQSTQLSLSGPVESVTAAIEIAPAHPSANLDVSLQLIIRTASGSEHVQILPLHRVKGKPAR